MAVNRFQREALVISDQYDRRWVLRVTGDIGGRYIYMMDDVRAIEVVSDRSEVHLATEEEQAAFDVLVKEYYADLKRRAEVETSRVRALDSLKPTVVE